MYVWSVFSRVVDGSHLTTRRGKKHGANVENFEHWEKKTPKIRHDLELDCIDGPSSTKACTVPVYRVRRAASISSARMKCSTSGPGAICWHHLSPSLVVTTGCQGFRGGRKTFV